ncbi:uroporphyrinogen decarboxylase family protein, partial [Chlamydia psittaci 84-8471/1]
MNLLAYV